MGKVTSKLQVTLPKLIADRYRIKPGDEIVWTPSGAFIRVQLRDAPARTQGVAAQLHLFDEATERQTKRQNARGASRPGPSRTRGWARDDLYALRAAPRSERGRAR